MVLYSALLIVLMLARPQGIFGPRELSWPWRGPARPEPRA